MNGSALVYIGLGGALGSVARYLTGTMTQGLSLRAGIPVGTLLVNVAGCFLIAVVATVFQKNAQLPENLRLFLIPGLFGGFTTYSALAWESSGLTGEYQFPATALYLFITILLGFLGIYTGAAAGRVLQQLFS